MYNFLTYSAGACRMRVTSYLMKRFRAPESVLSFFEGHTPMPVQPPVLHYRDNSTQTYAHSSDVLAQMKTLLTALPEEEQASTIGQLMQYIAPPDVNVPPDFIKHALACMKNHTAAGRSNILAGLAKALGTKRPDGSSRMRITRPLSVLQIKANVRGKYGGMRQGKMKAMLSPKCKYINIH